MSAQPEPSQSRRHWLAEAPPGVWSQGTAVVSEPETVEQYLDMGWKVSGPYVRDPRRSHGLYHDGSKITGCGRQAAGLVITTQRPTCAVCLKVWRADNFDPHDAASSGAVR